MHRSPNARRAEAEQLQEICPIENHRAYKIPARFRLPAHPATHPTSHAPPAPPPQACAPQCCYAVWNQGNVWFVERASRSSADRAKRARPYHQHAEEAAASKKKLKNCEALLQPQLSLQQNRQLDDHRDATPSTNDLSLSPHLAHNQPPPENLDHGHPRPPAQTTSAHLLVHNDHSAQHDTLPEPQPFHPPTPKNNQTESHLDPAHRYAHLHPTHQQPTSSAPPSTNNSTPSKTSTASPPAGTLAPPPPPCNTPWDMLRQPTCFVTPPDLSKRCGTADFSLCQIQPTTSLLKNQPLLPPPAPPPSPSEPPSRPPPITWEHICSLKNPNFSPSDNGPLLCREHEYKLILTSLSQFMVPLNHSSDVVQGGILFVAGVPGTGKTATVARVIQKLQSQLHFNLIQINSMKLTNPKKIFGLLLQNLNLPERRAAPPSKPNSERAQVLLDTHYRNPHVAKPVTMLVLDELEMLLTRNQQILYTLFEWARIENSNFVFVGISNMMDLPERLHPKIQSRMGSDRILFHAYQPQQLETILRNLFSPYLHIFEDESVLSYLSKKAGASRGDVRHLFELCKHLLRTAESDASANQPRNALISKKHVDRVVCMMEQTPRTLALKTASYHEKLWCVSVLLDIAQRRKIKQQLLLQNDGKPHPHDRDALEEDSTHFEFTVKQYLALCKKYNIPSCTTMNLQQISHRMGQMQIFNLNWQDRTLQRQIYLNLDPEDVLSALCLDQRLKEIVNNEELNKHYDS